MLRKLFGLVALASAVGAAAERPLLLQKPTLSRSQIAFVYAGDLWIVGREGGDARRLTIGTGIGTDPVFSPDGTQIAFTGEYDGNLDVFVVPAAGGMPRRLTYHPGADNAVGWTPDGKQVLFRSPRNSYSGWYGDDLTFRFFSRLFTMQVEGGGFPTELPLPMAEEASYSPDGARLAYVPLRGAFHAWKRYRGGRTTPIWIVTLADSRIEKIPRKNSNDFNPMWVGDRVYFLSDRNGPATLFYYDTASKRVREVLKNDGFDIQSASAGPGGIVYEQFGALHLLDFSSGKARKLDIRVAGDLPEVRPHFVRVTNRLLRSWSLSPTGAEALFEARGEILTVSAEKGDVRNLTNSPAVADRDPSWSPDGKYIAYFSDESGEYALQVRAQDGRGEVRKFDLGNPPSFYHSPTWSPDSKQIAYTDIRLNIWYLDLEKKTPVRVDTDRYWPWPGSGPPVRSLVWSPDNRWLAYTKQLRNHMGAVFVYSLETGQAHQITDGMSNVRFVALDKNGKYLYFTASTDDGPAIAWADLSSFSRPITRSVYVVVLSRDEPSPLAPKSEEEKAEEPKKTSEKLAGQGVAKTGDQEKERDKDKKAEDQVAVRIDLENIGQRILALPIPARNYTALYAGKSGTLFLLERLPPSAEVLHKFDLKTRNVEKVLEGVRSFALSYNGEKMLVRQGERWDILPAGEPPRPGAGANPPLKVDVAELRSDPRAEWRQMYREVWRIERDFFYDPSYHGLDLRAAAKKYEPYLEDIAARVDLNYLFREMLGELSVSHIFVGGDAPQVKGVPVGLLGADYRIENGRYRFARVYNGENWNPQLRAPLTQPGVNVGAGEYLLAVNGRNLTSSDNLYSFFEATAGKSVVLRVAPDPGGTVSREVTVVPVASETGLRNRAWIEDNRRKVDQMSGGRLAYIYLPDTASGGYRNFNRYFFAQVGKEGAVIDERFNGGGLLADYIIDYLKRPLMSMVGTREGEDFASPQGAIYGPKAMIINEYAGSGGDVLAWYFRRAGIGPLVGKRTWGGLVGDLEAAPSLLGGGFVTAPQSPIYDPNGQWEVENHGVPPDIEVDLDPQAVRSGHDPQLEKAVEVVMEALKKNPFPAPKRAPYPKFH